MKELTKENLKIDAYDAVFWRGEDLYHNDAVTVYDIENGGVFAKVMGSKLYKTEFNSTGEYAHFKCSCPYNQGMVCKHGVALGLKILSDKNILAKLKSVCVQDKSYFISDEIDKLINLATKKEIHTFLKDVFKSNPTMFNKFQTLIKGQKNVDDEVSIEDIATYVKEELESFDLDDYERFYDYDNNNCGYRKDWEILYDGAEEELQELFSGLTYAIDSDLEEDNIVQAIKEFCGLYEGIYLANLQDIKDDACIYDGDISCAVVGKFTDYMKTFISTFTKIEKQSKAVEKIITLVFQRIDFFEKNKNSQGFHYDISVLKELLISFIVDKKRAIQIRDKLMILNLPLSQTDEVFEAIFSYTKDQDSWLKNANLRYMDNYNIALKLLKCCENNRPEFLKIATEIAFEFDGKLLSYLSEFLKKDDDAEFYKNILFTLGIKERNLSTYRNIKKNYKPQDMLEYIEKIKKSHHYDYYVKLLSEEESYSKILKFVEEKIDSWAFNSYIKPILNIYPLECFNIVSKMVNKSLKNSGSRFLYRTEAERIKLFYDNKNSDVKKMAKKLAESLLSKYSIRRAMKEEFKNSGVV